jgi:hypothetical protein
MFFSAALILSLSFSPLPALLEDPVRSSAPGGSRMRLRTAAIISELRGPALMMQLTYVEQSQCCQLWNNESKFLYL